MTSPAGAPALLWPVGEPASERLGAGLPAGWAISIGYDRVYNLSPKGRTPKPTVHPGLDLAAGVRTYGADVYAVAAGVVVYAGKPGGSWGSVIMIDHPNVPGFGRICSQYAHLSNRRVKVGAKVAQGQIIGDVGDSDGLFGAHLHFELRKAGPPMTNAGYWPSMGGADIAEQHRRVRAWYVNPYGRLGV